MLCPTNTPLVLAAARQGTNFVLSFATQTNRSYIVQFTDKMLPINWQVLTNVTGDGSMVMMADSITNQRRFYRVIAE